MALPFSNFTRSPFWTRVKKWNWDTIAFVLGVKILLFVFAAQCFDVLEEPYESWMQIWQRWDAVHYVAIAERGYTNTGPDSILIVFYPLYPWLVRLTAFVTKNFVAAAFVVSGFASITAALILQKLMQLDDSRTTARAAVWFLFIFPTSYFLHAAYTEALFLALTLGCFLAARTNRWEIAGLLGAGACLTRVNGLILAPALALEVFTQFRATRRINWRWLWIGLLPIGFLIYLALNHHVTGNYFAFSEILKEHWFKKFTPPWIGIRDVWLRVGGENAMEGLHEFVYIALGFVCIVWSWWRLRASYAIWTTLNWLLFTSTAFVLSVPRYTLTLFPVFILCARGCTGRRLWFALVSICFLLYQSLYVARFVRGYWAF